MPKRILLLVCFVSVHLIHAQKSFFQPADSLQTKRVVPVTIGIGTIWTGSMIGLSQIWYKDVTKSPFHTFDDGSNWLQMDKVGHVYTNYKISLLCGDALKWSGINHKKASYLATGIGLGYQTTLEFFDAYSSDWGFSWYDMLSNVLGGGIYLGQELKWDEQRLLLKFSYHPTEFAALRPEILGSNLQERLLKDYNGQTYWLSFSPCLFRPKTTFPKWLCFSFGYSVNAKIVGDQEIFQTTVGGEIKNYSASREWIFSMDIDFSKIPVTKPWLRVLLKQLNYLKVPFPALIIRDGNLIGSPLYF